MASIFGCGQSNISMLEKGSRELTKEQIDILYAIFDKEKIDAFLSVPNTSANKLYSCLFTSNTIL